MPSTRDSGDDPTARIYKNLAVTDLAAVTVTVQVVPEAESHPLHPAKVERKDGLAVRVTTVP